MSHPAATSVCSTFPFPALLKERERGMAVRNFREVCAGLEPSYALSREDFGSCRLKEGMIYRGGDLDLVTDMKEVAMPKTVLNLRMRPDPEWIEASGVRMLHFPFRNTGINDTYETKKRENRMWLREVMVELGKLTEADFPLYIHCRSGKDRTGLLVALLLLLLDTPLPVVIEDYLCIEVGEVKREWIETALVGVYDTRQALLKCFSKAKLSSL